MAKPFERFQRLAGLSLQHPWHLIWVTAAYLPCLGSMSVPLTGDQKVYISTAMEMRERGSWLKPMLFGEPSFYKPPFQYWATILGWEIAGFNLWGTLLPSVLCVLLTVWLLNEISRLLNEKRAFVSSGLWFAATLGAVTYGVTAQMEVYLCLFYAASWWAALKYLNADDWDRRRGKNAAPSDERRSVVRNLVNGPNGERNALWLYLAFAIAGLSSIVKSPLYSVFWVVGFLTFLLISGEWEMFRKRQLYLAWLLGIAVGSAWYLALFAGEGPRFWSDYVMRETWEKKGGNQSGPFGIWLALLYLAAPLTLLVLPSARALVRGRRSTPFLKFVVSWCLWPALFFTIYPYRVNTYLFLLVPALAVMVDWGYYTLGRTRAYRGFMWATGSALLLLLALMGFVFLRAGLLPLWICLGFFGAGTAALACAGLDRARGLAVSGLAAMLFFRLAAVHLGEQDVADLKAFIASQPQTQVAMLDEKKNIWHEIGLLSVGVTKPLVRLYDVDAAAMHIRQGGWLALSDEQAQAFLPEIQAKLSNDPRALQTRSWNRWKGRLKFPYKDVILNGRESVPGFAQMLKREFKLVGY